MPKKQSKPQANKNAPQAPEVVRRTEQPASGVPLAYVNGFQVAVGALDVRLYLLETIAVSATEIVDKRLMALVMTPETMKMLANSLKDFVQNYESKFGKLRNFDVTSAVGLITKI